MNKNDSQGKITMSLPEPVTEEILRIRDMVSPERWMRMVKEAQDRVRIIQEVELLRKRARNSLRKCLKQVAPNVGRSCYLHWRRRLKKEKGPEWERLDWISIDSVQEYLEASKFRFDEFSVGNWVEARGQRSFILREKPSKFETVKT